MALRFLDSFSHYTTVTQKWPQTTSGGDGSISISGGDGRLAGDALSSVHGNGAAGNARRTFDAQQDWIVGFALKFSGTPNNTPPEIATFRDGTSTQIGVRLTNALKLEVHRAGTTLATGATTLSAGVWYYVELKVKIDNSTGTYELRINGVTEVSGSGADTQATGNATADTIALGNIVGASNNFVSFLFSDFYLCDGTGGSPTNTFLGDSRVEYRAPDGNGNSSQLTGSDGNSTDNYLLVDEHPPNDDTDYVESSNVGDKDTYTFQNLVPTGGTVFGVQIGQYAKKTDAGTRKICSVARLSGTEVDSADEVLSTSYGYFFDIRETKPGGGAWTVSDVNSAEFGPKVTA